MSKQCQGLDPLICLTGRWIGKTLFFKCTHLLKLTLSVISSSKTVAWHISKHTGPYSAHWIPWGMDIEAPRVLPWSHYFIEHWVQPNGQGVPRSLPLEPSYGGEHSPIGLSELWVCLKPWNTFFFKEQLSFILPDERALLFSGPPQFQTQSWFYTRQSARYHKDTTKTAAIVILCWCGSAGNG